MNLRRIQYDDDDVDQSKLLQYQHACSLLLRKGAQASNMSTASDHLKACQGNCRIKITHFTHPARLQSLLNQICRARADVLQSQPAGDDLPLDYFRAVEIRDKLAESTEKGLFGGLSGAAAVWDQIVKSYEKDSIYLGEAAQTLIQNTNYEISFLRKQAAKYDQQISDQLRRHAEYLRSASAAAEAYQQVSPLQVFGGIHMPV